MAGVIFQHRLAWSPIDRFSAPATGPTTTSKAKRDGSRIICLPLRVLHHNQQNKLFAGSWRPVIAFADYSRTMPHILLA
jgi:hypothetical protein